MTTFITPSTENISFKRYQTSFYYETMNFLKDELNDITENPFFKHMIGATETLDFTKGTHYTDLKRIRYDILDNPILKETVNLEKYIFQEQIFKNLFKYSIQHLLKTRKNTLFILPSYDQVEDNGASRFIKDIESAGITQIYKDIFTNTRYTIFKNILKPKQPTTGVLPTTDIDSNQIMFIRAFSTETNETMDAYKDRITEDIKNIEQTIKNRGIDSLNEPFTEIAYFVNNDNTIFTHYFKTELKKKYADELNKQINEFYSKQ